MTSRFALFCGACGSEDYDVVMTLVEFPEADRRLIDIPMPVNSHINAPLAPVTVPERYAREPRCRDRDACADRVAAFTPKPEPVIAVAVTPAPEPVEEEPQWQL